MIKTKHLFLSPRAEQKLWNLFYCNIFKIISHANVSFTQCFHSLLPFITDCRNNFGIKGSVLNIVKIINAIVLWTHAYKLYNLNVLKIR